MTNPFLALISQSTPQGPEDSWVWAVVTRTFPLQIKLDTDATPLDLVPTNLGPPVVEGNRVWVQIHSRRVFIHSNPWTGNSTPSSPWQRTVPAAPPWISFPGGPGVTDFSQGQSWRSPAFLKTSAGIVVLSGILGGTLNGLLGTLPEGYRPSARLMFDAANGSSDGIRVDVLENGEVWWQTGSTTPGYISLDGISFPAVGAVEWIPITTFASGWAAFPEATWGVPSYALDACGRLWHRGLLRGTPITTLPGSQNQVMFTHSAALRPSQQLHLPSISPTVDLYGMIAAEGDGGVSAKGKSSTSFISLSRVMWCPGSTFPANDPRRKYMKGRNSWTRYSGTHPAPQTIVHADGFATCEGLIASGTVGARALVFPPGYRPDASPYDSMASGGTVHTVVASEARARADLKAGMIGGVESEAAGYEVVNGPNAWHSMNGVNYIVGAY